MNIGIKLKEIRKQKGITQAELCGDIITRNMLSQIESGKATPSLSTLFQIAKKLNVPVEYLISEDTDIFPFEKKSVIAKIKNEFTSKRYHGCITIFENELGEADDEISLMLAYSHIECAKSHFFNGNLDTTIKYIKNALEYCSKTIYPTHDIEATASLIGAISENVQSPKLEFDSENFLKSVNDAVCLDLYCYITEDKTHTFFNETMAKHLRAKELIRSFYYTDAMYIMSEIEHNKSSLKVDATTLFNIYCDMEYCCKELKDYEGAYKYSSKRIALLSAFKS